MLLPVVCSVFALCSPVNSKSSEQIGAKFSGNVDKKEQKRTSTFSWCCGFASQLESDSTDKNILGTRSLSEWSLRVPHVCVVKDRQKTGEWVVEKATSSLLLLLLFLLLALLLLLLFLEHNHDNLPFIKSENEGLQPLRQFFLLDNCDNVKSCNESYFQVVTNLSTFQLNDAETSWGPAGINSSVGQR